jgi:hypothetical protein
MEISMEIRKVGFPNRQAGYFFQSKKERFITLFKEEEQ